MWRSTSDRAAFAVFAAFVALVSCGEQHSAAQLQDNPMFRAWLDHVQSFPAHLQKDVLNEESRSVDSANYNFKVQWFTQKLDHVNKQQFGTWNQRYFVYDKFSRLEKNYPLFVFCGGEQGDIFQEWQRLGFMVEVARAHGAKVLWLEHRFFGESMPFRSADVFAKRMDRVGLLSLEQSLADYAAIIRKHQGEGPVLTFGGSLSGTIAAMMRVQYPTLVDMAFASSAPIMGVDGVADPFAWRARLTNNFAELGSPGCPDAVRRGFAAMAAAVASPGGKASHGLWKASGLCEKEPMQAHHWQALTNLAWGQLEALGNFVYPASLSGIPSACKRMVAAASGEEVFPALLGLGAAAPKGRPCLNLTKLAIGGPPSPVGVGWSYMACTEVVHPIGANNKTDMFPAYDWTVPNLAASCRQGWGVIPDANYLRHKLPLKVKGFGAKAEVQRSDALPGRVLFSYGDHDPWGTMVPKQGWADDVKIIKVPGGAHCSDLETPRKEDTKDMLDARHKISGVLSQWIQEVQKMRVMKVNSFGHNSSQVLQKFGKATLRGAKGTTGNQKISSD